MVNYSEYFCDDHEKFCLKANNFDIRQIKNTNPTSLTVDLLRIKGKCSRNKLTELVPETLFLALLNYIPISLLKRNQMQTWTHSSCLVKAMLENHKSYRKLITNGELYGWRSLIVETFSWQHDDVWHALWQSDWQEVTHFRRHENLSLFCDKKRLLKN